MKLPDPQGEPGLPMKIEPCSNGEYNPPPLSPIVREAVRRSWADADAAARKLGWTRRRFLASLCGSAVTLLALNACSREATGPRSEPAGRFSLDPTSGTDLDAAGTVLRGQEFVIDGQTHLLELDQSQWTDDFLEGFLAFGRASFAGGGFVQSNCGEADARACFTTEHYAEETFLRSDTDVTLLSCLPVFDANNPLSIQIMDEARAVIDRLCESPRVMISGQAMPNIGAQAAVFDAMSEAAVAYDITAWKIFTHLPSDQPFWLDDHDPDLPAVGDALLERIAETGVHNICVHKGFSGGSPYASPEDIGPAAVNHPDLTFVVYHSGYDIDIVEGPYDSTAPAKGVDRLIKTLRDNNIAPGSNVLCDLGSTWRSLMPYPDQAAHVLGKLLLTLGEDNILWGTDSIWYGSPQDQIQAFRAFEITEWAQERYGYPALTQRIKAKILGENAARIYGIERTVEACEFSRAELEQIRLDLPPDRLYGPTSLREQAQYIAAHGVLP